MSAHTATGSVRVVAIEQLRTSYARLRPGGPRRAAARDPVPLPIRVVPTAQGGFEVIDGFKRLAASQHHGAHELAVVIEPPADPHEHKRLLLAANAPPRTITALDEARVVCSLIDDDQQSLPAVARLLGKRRQWVERRLAIGRRLCPRGQQKLAVGLIAPTLAHRLCALPAGEQDALLATIERHALKPTEALALLSAWAVADPSEQRALLRNPLATVRRAVPHTFSPHAMTLEHRLKEIGNALRDLATFEVPAELAPAEQRRLAALYRATRTVFDETARALAARPTPKEPAHEPTNGADRNHPPGDTLPARARLRDPPDCAPTRILAQDRAPRAERGGPQPEPSPCTLQPATEQAQPVPDADRSQGPPGADDLAHPARDPQRRLPGGPHDPG
jgi:hypothetical protein